MIKEFIVHINKNHISLQSTIESSIYETNSFLQNKELTLIEYAMFFGSIQIFRYLCQNKVKLTEQSWMYAIHGNHSEIIHFLEDEKKQPENNNYLNILKETIKCHHNEITIYLQNNFFDKEYSKIICSNCLKYYNFQFINILDFDSTNLYNLCRYDYGFVIQNILNEQKVDLNSIVSSNSHLYISALKENFEVVKLLLSYPTIDVNKCYQNKSEKIFEHKYYKFYNYTEYITEKISPLYISILNENVEIVQLLLSKTDIDVNFCYTKNIDKVFNTKKDNTNIKKSSLFAAIESENIEIVNLLLSNQDINLNLCYNEIREENKEIREEKKNLLYVAIENDFIDAVRVLLSQRKININYINKIIVTVSPDEIYDEEENDKKGNEDDDDLYGYEKSGFKTYDDFFEGREDEEYDEDEKTALFIAIEKENIEIISLLLSDENIDINIPSKRTRNWKWEGEGGYEAEQCKEVSKSALCVAVERKNINVIQLLLSQTNLDVNYINEFKKSNIKPDYYKSDHISLDIDYKRCKTALCVAVENEDIEIIKLLLSHEDIDANYGYTYIRNWCYYTDLSSNLLVDEDCNEYKDRNETKSNLCIAIEKGNIEIVNLLVSFKNLDINMIGYSVKEKWTKETDDEKLNSINDIEYNSLYFAVEKGNVEIVKLLLENNNLNINAKSQFNLDKKIKIIKKVGEEEEEEENEEIINNESTALHLAVKNNNVEIIKLLLSNDKININIKDKNGKTAVQYANDKEIQDLFK